VRSQAIVGSNSVKVGITGHQRRRGIKWPWVSEVLSSALSDLLKIEEAFSSLAEGSDQIFAEVALELAVPVKAVIPLPNYESYFRRSALAKYHRLLNLCAQIRLHTTGDPEIAFFEAGKFVVDMSDILFAVWDGEEAFGLACTANIVAYAKSKDRHIIHVDPLHQSIRKL
jgi:hypothetical protein